MGAIYRNGFKYGDGNGVAQNPVLAVKLGDELRKPENGIVELPDEAITVSATGADMNIATSKGRLNALTVYGKSAVVDDEIVSAGEGWATVDLGTLTWEYNSSVASNPFFYASDINIKLATSQAINENLVCVAYNTYSFNTTLYDVNIYKAIAVNSVDNAYKLVIKNPDYTDATSFKTAMSGIILAYQLADPTQGNCIAIKTDDGTGIDGTMAVFSTGTPLRGIPNTDIRDAMAWDGSSGTVTKNCGKVRLADLEWSENQSYPGGFSASLPNALPDLSNYISNYSYNTSTAFAWSKFDNFDEHIIYRTTYNDKIYIKATEYASNLTDFVASLGDAELIYELAASTTQPLTTEENASLASLRTFTPSTRIQNNAGADMAVNAYSRTANGKAVNAVNVELDSMINDSAATNTSTYSSEKIEDLLAEAVPKKIETPHTTTEIDCGVAENVTFSGLTYFRSNNIWTDGTDVYYSYATDQYVLSPLTRTWTAKTWTGLTDFYGGNIWTDGENIYYSYNENQYVLDKSTSTWSAKTWNGLSSFGGSNTWTDGENIYYSGSSNHYVLDKSTSTWSTKTWSSAPNYFSGNRVWSDGENIYYSAGTSQHVLDKDTSTWKAKTWNGLTSFSGDYIWTDGKNIYYSKNQEQYVLNKLTSTWIAKTWINTSYLQGTNVWTDGENLYCAENNNVHKKLTPSLTYKSIRLR